RLDPERGGVIGFVTNASWLDGNSHDGFRKCIEEDFSKIYVFDLRGNQRTSGELSRKEGGKIFGSGSRAPIAITFLVKNPSKNKEEADIFYYDVGNYLSKDDKLNILSHFSSISNQDIQWTNINPNEHGDWLSKRKEAFGNFISIEPENKFDHEAEAFFNTYAIGISTNRDAWVYDSSKDKLQSIIPPMIDFYNSEREEWAKRLQENDELSIAEVVDSNSQRISWTRKLRRRLKKNKVIEYNKNAFVKSLYRPFFKQHLYFDKDLIEMPGLYDRFYPNKIKDNKTIVVSGPGANKGFSCLITDSMTNMDCIQKGQGFPLYHYKEKKIEDPSLFDKKGEKLVRKDGVSDFILNQASKRYSDRVTKKDIFYYVYGLLHSKKY